MNIIEEVVNYLIKNNIKISVCESLTGGLLASKIVEIPGSSSVFSLGIVTYSNEMKEKFLNVKRETIELYDVVSEEVVKEMVLGLEKQVESDVYISTSGYAGPTGLNVGKVCFSIKIRDVIKTFTIKLENLNRNEIREETVNIIFKELKNLLHI